MSIIQADFASMGETQDLFSQKVEEFRQAVEELMSAVNSTEWEAADRDAYQELQEMWNNDDESMQTALNEISAQVAAAQQGYQDTISTNASRLSA